MRIIKKKDFLVMVHKVSSYPILEQLGFHGSYRPEDITFILKIADIQPTPVEEKERLIQSGQKHYSQMISMEKAPSDQHLQHFEFALQQGAKRLAGDVQRLAKYLVDYFPQQEIVLISLVRAGVPLGVLLKHQIEKTQSCAHYGISIIRDRGIDFAALEAILQQHDAKYIVFVDGWTGKGAISRELQASLKDYPDLFDQISQIPRLVTLADLGGYSWLTASADDWLIPFGILGSVISGLTSRSFLECPINQLVAKSHCFEPKYWHRCVLYDHLASYDRSVEFIDQINALIEYTPVHDTIEWNNDLRLQQQAYCLETIKYLAQTYDIEDINRIKPSIAEATRAVLRRVPDRILIRDVNDPHVQLLLHFAQQQNVPVDIVAEQLGPYRAVTLIKKIENKP